MSECERYVGSGGSGARNCVHRERAELVTSDSEWGDGYRCEGPSAPPVDRQLLESVLLSPDVMMTYMCAMHDSSGLRALRIFRRVCTVWRDAARFAEREWRVLRVAGAFGEKGGEAQQLSSPTDVVALRGGGVVVCDSGNARLQVIPGAGEWRAIGQSGVDAIA